MNSSPTTTTSIAPKIYADQLADRGRGVALWYPEPSRDDREVQIGDVGYIRDGRFHCLFNAFVDGGHPWNSQGVPDDFQPLPYDDRWVIEVSRELPEGFLFSPSITSSRAPVSQTAITVASEASPTLDLQLEGRQGALLLTKEAMRKVYLMSRTTHYYFKTNLKSWSDHARSCGLDVNDYDLIFVNGWTKSSAWYLAVFNAAKRGSSRVFEKTVNLAGKSITLRLSSLTPFDVEDRYNDGTTLNVASKSQDPDAPGDQCLFLVGLHAKRRAIFPGFKIIAAADVQRPPSFPRDSSFAGGVPISSYNPTIYEINNYYSSRGRHISALHLAWIPMRLATQALLLSAAITRLWKAILYLLATANADAKLLLDIWLAFDLHQVNIVRQFQIHYAGSHNRRRVHNIQSPK